MKIFLDAGHNHSGADTGATGNGLKEQDVTYRIAEILSPLLVKSGHEVKMSRNSITDNVCDSVAVSIRRTLKWQMIGKPTCLSLSIAMRVGKTPKELKRLSMAERAHHIMWQKPSKNQS